MVPQGSLSSRFSECPSSQRRQKGWGWKLPRSPSAQCAPSSPADRSFSPLPGLPKERRTDRPLFWRSVLLPQFLYPPDLFSPKGRILPPPPPAQGPLIDPSLHSPWGGASFGLCVKLKGGLHSSLPASSPVSQGPQTFDLCLYPTGREVTPKSEAAPLSPYPLD